MYDFHMHTLLGDGELLPSELISRAARLGLKGIAIAEHADQSNLELLVKSLLRFQRGLEEMEMKVLIGLELTHVPPSKIPSLVNKARKLGAQLVCVHGESFWEPVPRGTNLAAIQSGADILFHPGLISPEVCELAKQNDVILEITAKKGHCLANGHIAKLSSRLGFKLVFGSDAHSPQDLCSPQLIRKIALGAGLDPNRYREMIMESERLIYKKFNSSSL